MGDPISAGDAPLQQSVAQLLPHLHGDVGPLSQGDRLMQPGLIAMDRVYPPVQPVRQRALQPVHSRIDGVGEAVVDPKAPRRQCGGTEHAQKYLPDTLHGRPSLRIPLPFRETSFYFTISLRKNVEIDMNMTLNFS